MKSIRFILLLWLSSSGSGFALEIPGELFQHTFDDWPSCSKTGSFVPDNPTEIWVETAKTSRGTGRRKFSLGAEDVAAYRAWDRLKGQLSFGRAAFGETFRPIGRVGESMSFRQFVRPDTLELGTSFETLEFDLESGQVETKRAWIPLRSLTDVAVGDFDNQPLRSWYLQRRSAKGPFSDQYRLRFRMVKLDWSSRFATLVSDVSLVSAALSTENSVKIPLWNMPVVFLKVNPQRVESEKNQLFDMSSENFTAAKSGDLCQSSLMAWYVEASLRGLEFVNRIAKLRPELAPFAPLAVEINLPGRLSAQQRLAEIIRQLWPENSPF